MKLLLAVIFALQPLVIGSPLDDPAAPAPALVDTLQKRESCTVTGAGGLNGAGTCQLNDVEHCRYVSVTGFCSGGANNQCCRVIPCTGQYSGWTCRNTYKACSGRYVSGYCPGTSSVKCCVP